MFYIVLTVVGFGLLALGGFSGVALFARALKISDRFRDETNVGTLWGLFLFGLCGGLFLVWWGL